jgi:hypothetical protein
MTEFQKPADRAPEKQPEKDPTEASFGEDGDRKIDPNWRGESRIESVGKQLDGGSKERKAGLIGCGEAEPTAEPAATAKDSEENNIHSELDKDSESRCEAGSKEPDADTKRQENRTEPGSKEAIRNTDGECPRDESGRESAEHTLPDRFHEHIESSEIISVRPAAEYNREGSYSEDIQPAWREKDDQGRNLKVVEMRLGRDLPAGQACVNDGGNLRIGNWFSDHAPANQTPLQIRENFSIPPHEKTGHGTDKNAVVYGHLKAGSIVRIGEVERVSDETRSKYNTESFRTDYKEQIASSPALSGPHVRTIQFELVKNPQGGAEQHPREHFVFDKMDVWLLDHGEEDQRLPSDQIN